MSLYNMINGVNPLTFLAIPMLGDKHPEDYPRFRDCFAKDEEHPEYDNHIHVYTRVGGGNRGCGYGEEELLQHPDFVATFDDSFDSTYATYVFKIPKRWQKDWDLILEGKLNETSKEYQHQVDKVFPKLKGKLSWHKESS